MPRCTATQVTRGNAYRRVPDAVSIGRMRIVRCSLAAGLGSVVLLLVGVPAHGSLPSRVAVQEDPPREALACIAQAEHALAAGRGEDALVLLWAAREGLAGLPGSAREAAYGALEELLPKADPLFAERTRIEHAAARSLLSLARAYRGRKWIDAASRIAEQAVLFDRASVTKEFPRAGQGADGTGAGSLDGASASDPYSELGQMLVDGEWQVRDGALHTPELTDVPAMYLTNKSLDDHRIELSVDIGDRSAMFGVLVGARAPDDLYIVDFQFWKGNGVVLTRLWRWSGGELKDLAGAQVDLGRFRQPSVRFEVLVRGSQVEAVVDGTSVLVGRAEELMHGTFGFYVSPSSEHRGSLAIRDLRISPTPREGQEGPTPNVDEGLQREVAAALTEAEELLARKLPEPAAERLRNARGSVLEIAAPTLRASLLGSIDQLLDATDPLEARRRKVFADAASSFQPLAEQYSERGLHRAAAAVAGWMAALDPEGRAATAQAFQERITER